MARYECIEGGASKFWEITLEGTSFTARWGRIGTKGQSKTQQFGNEDLARREHDKLIESKLKKGYQLVGDGGAEPVAATHTVISVRFEAPEHMTRQWREITLDRRVVRVRSGWNTMELDPTIEKLADDGAARFAFDRHVNAALKADLVEVERNEKVIVDAPFVRSKLATNPELEAAMLAAPDDPQPAAVYADFLQSQGDVRGELAALWIQKKDADAALLIDRHAEFLWGRAAPHAEARVTERVWRHGFLTSATLAIDPDEDLALETLTAGLLEAPLGAWLESLRFGLQSIESDNDWTDTIRAVTSSRRAARVRSLRFDHYTSSDCELSWTPFGDLSDAWQHLPALEHLKIRSGAGGTLGALVLPRLRSFIRESGGLSAAELQSIAQARWPALEHLEIWTGHDHYGAQGTIQHVLPMLTGAGLSHLRHLGIVNCLFVADVVAALAESKLLPQLTSLDLSKGALIDADVPMLLKVAPALAHLEALDLRENQLSDQTSQQILEALPRAKVSDQRPDGDERYVAVGE